VEQEHTVLGFSWDFLDEMTVWAVWIAAGVALVGGVMLQSVSFAVGCLVAAGIDVALVRVAAHRARREMAGGRIDAAAPTVMLAGRLVAKALLLTLALFVPYILGFAGTVAGALVFDLTLVIVGSVIAAARTMRRPKEGR
jgi:hypothetical protein